jgi:hypothetical protein
MTLAKVMELAWDLQLEEDRQPVPQMVGFSGEGGCVATGLVFRLFPQLDVAPHNWNAATVPAVIF